MADLDVKQALLDAVGENKKLRARITELETEREWQPIETAPRRTVDGLLVKSTRGEFVAFDCDEDWYTEAPDGSQQLVAPTHWAPLPKMPEGK